jgi:ABC transporter with metal-binding/Fe-S-binding domain ATP-binding protein
LVKALKVAVLFSGGKDSTFALWCAQMLGWDVSTLVTVFPKSEDSWMFHYPALRWTRLQAQAVGIPQTTIPTEGAKEKELEDLTAGLGKVARSSGIEGVVSGAVASEYQRTRLDNICEGLGLRSFAPLWHKNQEQLVKEQIESGFDIIITACNALGLDARWLGRKLGQSELAELVQLNRRFGLSIAFEGGEAETFVLGAPLFKGHLSIVHSTPHWHGESGYLDLEEVQLENAT